MRVPDVLRTQSLLPAHARALAGWLARTAAGSGDDATAWPVREAERLLETIFGTGAPRWGELATVHDDDVLQALSEMGWRLPVQRRRALAEALRAYSPAERLCDTCGEAALTSLGGEIDREPVDGAACRFCETGHVAAVGLRVARLAWTTGRVIPLDDLHDRTTWPGEAVPLDDDGVRVWLGSSLDPGVESFCARHGVELTEYLAFLRLIRGRVRTLEDAWHALCAGTSALDDEDSEGDLGPRIARFRDEYLPRCSWPAPERALGTRPARDNPNAWRLERCLARGAHSDVWLARRDATFPWRALIKLSTTHEAGEVLLAERATLARIHEWSGRLGQPDPMWCPRAIDWFAWNAASPAPRTDAGPLQPADPDGATQPPRREATNARAALVLDWRPGFTHTLEQVRTIHGDALRPESTVWVLKRLLEALHVAHQASVMHAALHPGHVLVTPHGHAVRLVGWSHAQVLRSAAPVALRERVRERRSFYAAAAWEGQAVRATADLVAAARTASWLACGDPSAGALTRVLPGELADLVRGWCEFDARRPTSPQAWVAELVACATDTLGPPRYAPIALPG